MATEDYMSDSFLLGLEDVRPGLKTRSQKRKDKASEPSITQPKHKKLKASEQEARSKGLATHISTENKGFSMLQKMGYKKGMGLGKKGEIVRLKISISIPPPPPTRCWYDNSTANTFQRRFDFACVW